MNESTEQRALTASTPALVAAVVTDRHKPATAEPIGKAA